MGNDDWVALMILALASAEYWRLPVQAMIEPWLHPFDRGPLTDHPDALLRG